MGWQNCKQEHHPNELNHRRSFVPSNTSFVGLTGIWISFVSVVQLLTLALSLMLLPFSGDQAKILTAFDQMCLSGDSNCDSSVNPTWGKLILKVLIMYSN